MHPTHPKDFPHMIHIPCLGLPLPARTPRRSRALTLAALTGLVLPLGISPASAATSFRLDGPTIDADQEGRGIALRINPASGTQLDCDSLSLQAVEAGGANDLAIDWQASGCWSGGANLVTTIPAGLASGRVRITGQSDGHAPSGTASIDGTEVQALVGAQGAEASTQELAGSFGWVVPGTIPQGASGRLSMRVIPTRGASLDCDSVSLEVQDESGRWQAMAVDRGASGCWSGGAHIVSSVADRHAGRPVRLRGTAVRTSSAQPVMVASLEVAGRSQRVGVKTVSSADIELTPAPSAEASAPVSQAPAAQNPAPQGPGTTPTRPAGSVTGLDLPRIPWEGGADYYRAFPDAERAGWTDPAHFPISVWWGGASTDAEVQYDKSLGINTYAVTSPEMDSSLFARNKVSYIGSGTRNQSRNDPAWAGDYLDDEVDGRFEAAQGLGHLQNLANQLPDHRKVRYANFTGMVISWHKNNARWDTAATDYTSRFTDVMSLDTYWYSSNQCDWENPNGFAYQVPFAKKNCRTGQNYGRSVQSLRWRDAQDGRLQPVWNFIENVDVTVDGTSHHDVTAAQIKAAAISSIIHEARGLVWFNQSFGGRCSTGNAVRDSQRKDYPCRDQVLAMGEVNNLVLSLAPVLNTQSYEWDFGDGLDTMLKFHDGAAHIFAMSDDLTAPGRRTFRVPPELRGRTVEVVGENRTITPAADGTFSDDFATVDSYRVYRIG